MFIGSHVIIYSRNAEKDRAFLRDVLKFTNIDVGGGWLIFGLPPSELAVHPGFSGKHEFYLMCEDVEAFVSAMNAEGVRCSERLSQGWGVLTEATLPSGTKLKVYEPRHARPPAPKASARPARKPVKKATKPTARKSGAKRKPSRKTARRR